MTLTQKQIYDLNHAMTANQNVSLGNIISALGGLAGVHTVTTAEDSASAVVLFATSGSTIQTYTASVARVDVPVTNLTFASSGSALTVSGSSLAAGDVVTYFIV